MQNEQGNECACYLGEYENQEKIFITNAWMPHGTWSILVQKKPIQVP